MVVMNFADDISRLTGVTGEGIKRFICWPLEVDHPSCMYQCLNCTEVIEGIESFEKHRSSCFGKFHTYVMYSKFRMPSCSIMLRTYVC